MSPLEPTIPSPDPTPPTPTARDGLVPFYLLACGLTWVLALPLALAWSRHMHPSALAVSWAGLSAFGPLIAVLLVARRREVLREVFGRWRARPLWWVTGLAIAPGIHLAATALYVAIGGHPTAWLHPPTHPEQMAALVVFPLGEEFGWRGFAHARTVRRHGLVRGSVVLGVVWGVWHLAYAVTPDAGRFDALQAAMTIVELPLYAVVIGWVFERSGRSMGVALAAHAGAHLDHFEPAARADLRLAAMHLVVAATVAVAVAIWVSRHRSPEASDE